MKVFILTVLSLFTLFFYTTDVYAQYEDCVRAAADPIILKDPSVNSCDAYTSNVFNLIDYPVTTPTAIGCSNTPAKNNQWFSVITPPNSGPYLNIELEVIGGCAPADLTEAGITFYRGASCGSLTRILRKCLNCNGPTCPSLKRLQSPAVTAGEKIYFQIHTNTDINCDVRMKIFPSPIFDDCTHPIDIEQKKYCNQGGTSGDPISFPGPCTPHPVFMNGIYSIDRPIWFKFTVNPGDPQPFAITMDAISCVSGQQSMQMMVYKNNPKCNCSNNFTDPDPINPIECLVACTAQDEPASSPTLTIIPGAKANPITQILPPGDYLLAIDGGDGADCTWGFNTTTLPVKFLNVVVQSLNSHTAGLKWLVAEQSESDYYEIQRSTDGVNFASIGIVQSKNQSILLAYSFQDYDISESSYYYQVIMHDIDGSITTSSMVHLQTERNDIVVLPTLVKEGFFHIKTESTELTTIEVMVHSVSGSLVLKKTFVSSEQLTDYVFETNGWANGIYIVTINDSEQVYIKKIEVVRYE